jgi:hypothetical protein
VLLEPGPVCKECGKKFRRAVDFGGHIKRYPSHYWPPEIAPLAGKPVQTRNFRTHRHKCKVLDDLKRLEDAGDPTPQTTVRVWHPGHSKHNISKWSQQRAIYYREVRDGRGDKRQIRTQSRVHFPLLENVLYLRFCWRRNVLGLKTMDLWVRLEMADILAQYQPNGWSVFRCSMGWLDNFKKRYRITCQVRTNKKETPIAQRLPRIKAFHK